MSATSLTSGKFQKYSSVLKGRRRPSDSSLWIAPTETAKEGQDNAETASRPELLPVADHGHAGPGRNACLCGAAQSRSDGQRRPCRAGRRSRVARLRRPDRARRTCPAPATSCTTSDGTRAARACARTRRTRTCSGATSWCPACGRRGFTFWTRSPTRGSRASSR